MWTPLLPWHQTEFSSCLSKDLDPKLILLIIASQTCKWLTKETQRAISFRGMMLTMCKDTRTITVLQSLKSRETCTLMWKDISTTSFLKAAPKARTMTLMTTPSLAQFLLFTSKSKNRVSLRNTSSTTMPKLQGPSSSQAQTTQQETCSN